VKLPGSSALVTGGCGGLGEATVRGLAAAGMFVVIGDVADDRGKELAADVGDRAVFVHTDATDDASINQAVAAASALGPFRVVVCAHGGQAAGGRIVGKDGTPMPLEGFRITLDYFLIGTFNVMRLAAAAMATSDPDEDGNRGVLITTASIAAFEGQIGQIAYSAAKGGVVGMTLVAARDLSPSGIRCVCIAPGTMFTPAYRMTEEDAQTRWGGNVPFPRRMGRPSEYAALVQHIAENDYLNGETIRLDGALRFQPR
jgi:NAD(P)-dependent dehydrogenase (short-subunit alcohol dehydrogenase family)